MQEQQQALDTRAWDPIIRVAHWSLAIFFSAAYWTGGDWLGLHAQLGYCALLVIGVRLLWGWSGPLQARFSQFVVGWKSLYEYLRRLPGSRQPWSAGHDPAGGWMIVALLGALLVTGLSGVVLFALENRGPLSGALVANWPGSWVEAVHHLASELVLILVCLHVLGVLLMSCYTRKNLLIPMLRRRHAPDE